MLIQNVKPAFGGKLKPDQWYATLNDVIFVLRPYSTLNTICDHLNANGFTTASDMPWTKIRLASYLKQHKI